MATPTIRTSRQRRAIQALVKYGKVTSSDLGRLTGYLNPPELVAQLRRNGWLVVCELFDVLDRDGKVCRPGRYFLKPESAEIAKKILDGVAYG